MSLFSAEIVSEHYLIVQEISGQQQRIQFRCRTAADLYSTSAASWTSQDQQQHVQRARNGSD